MRPAFSKVSQRPYSQTSRASEHSRSFKEDCSQAPSPVWSELGYILLGFASLVLAALLYNWLTRRRRRQIKIWHGETGPRTTSSALETATSHWAEYQLEIFSPNYPEVYRGRFLAVLVDYNDPQKLDSVLSSV